MFTARPESEVDPRSVGQRKEQGLTLTRSLNAYVTHGTQDNTDLIYAVVSSCLGVRRDRLTEETSLIEDLGIDSIDRLVLAVELEREFGVVIPDEALCGIQTIGDTMPCIARAIESQRINRGPAAVELHKHHGM